MSGPNFAAIDEAVHMLERARHHPAAKAAHKAIHEKGIDFNGGLIDSHIHGRTDKLPLNVPAGSYILPADIVSAVGQGNTKAGAHAIEEVVKDAPYSIHDGPYGSDVLPIRPGEGAHGVHVKGLPAPPHPLMPDYSPAPTFAPRKRGGRVAPHVKGAGIMIVAPGNMVLFLRRSGASGDHAGEWCFPGGHIEPGEAPSEAAVRETREEIGVDFPRHLHLWAHTRGEGVDFVTFAAPVERPFEPKIDAEHVGWRWAHAAVPPRPLHPGCAIALAKLLGVPPGGNNGRVGIIAAGGEYVVPPHAVRWFGGGTVPEGYKRLDDFVVKTRDNLRRTLSQLKPPKKD